MYIQQAFVLLCGIYLFTAAHVNAYKPTELNFKRFNRQVISDFKPKCDIKCKNNGICVDTNVCQCPVNFYGNYCQLEKKACLVYPPLPMNSRRKCSSEFCTITCMDGYKFTDGTTVANMRCVAGEWQSTSADLSPIPDCIPDCNPPCINGGVCLSPNTCQCTAAYKGPQCQYSNCDRECENNGICVAMNVCQCSANFYGSYCELEKKDCRVYPPLPMNSRRKCSSEFCTITCMDGYKFTDGTTVANMRCVAGEWQSTSADLSPIPDCIPA